MEVAVLETLGGTEYSLMGLGTLAWLAREILGRLQHRTACNARFRATPR